MNTAIQTNYTKLQSELSVIVSNVRAVEVSNRNTAKPSTTFDYARFMSAEQIEVATLFASFLGYDFNKTCFIIANSDWKTFSKYFS